MEKRAIPVAGEFYRHFKGNLYQIIGVAKHSETMEQMVVYQALYGDYCLYTRPLEMFLSPVDKEKYSDAVQEYRFEKCVPGSSEEKAVSVIKESEKVQETAPVVEPQKIDAAEETDDESVRPEILRFLDAEDAQAKLKVLRELRMDLDENLMTTIELSMDLLPDDKESLERRYDFVERTLEQRIRFEGSRLR
ncbi:MAG: DUF1653 domain-containing protein [Lachnospiraceae bacterium]|nr:DUF1653 domain-containing protein [Lachnospiraceae bacterium]MBP3579584.1 DUF1653 domain-containing protein [Lachnospiraceae bacterium]